MNSLDPETIATLKSLDEGDGFFAEIVETFQTNARLTFEQLCAAQGENNLQLVERAAHKLRGAASTIGAQKLMAVCGDLEHAARAGHIPDLTGAVAAIEAELQQVNLALQAEMQN